MIDVQVVNLFPIKTVFARCTHDDWQTFADLPAQYVPGAVNLGYEYDTFCFAVRKPVTGWREDHQNCGGRGWRGGGARGEGEVTPTAAVEFAVCYKVVGNTYWDNNEGENFRIEWFD